MNWKKEPGRQKQWAVGDPKKLGLCLRHRSFNRYLGGSPARVLPGGRRPRLMEVRVIKDEWAYPYHLIPLNIKPILAGVKAVLVEPAVPHLKLVGPHLRVKPDVPRLTVKLPVHSLNVSLVRGQHRAVVDIHLDLSTKGLALTLS